MKITCEYCGNLYDDNEAECPKCGAKTPVELMGDRAPKTIEELKQWYSDRGLPPAKTTRFFIGENYKMPKAFGIYQDGNYFIVYKNKADGSRAIRYKGTDEAYAVNELYMRLKEEILNQKALNADNSVKPDWKQSYKSDTPTADLQQRTRKIFNNLVKITAFLLIGGFILMVINAVLDSAVTSITTIRFVHGIHWMDFVAFAAMLLAAYVFWWISQIAGLCESIKKNQFGKIVSGLLGIVGITILAIIILGFGILGMAGDKKFVKAAEDTMREGYYIGCADQTDENETLWYYPNNKNWALCVDGDWISTSVPPYYEVDGNKISYSRFTLVPSGKYLGKLDSAMVEQLGYPSYFGSPLYEDTYCSYVRGYYKYDDKVYYCLKDSMYGFYVYDYDDGDWENEPLFELPPELRHPSLAPNFYYTPDWDSQTQITDFEDTEVFQEQMEWERAEAEREAKAAAERAYENDYNYDTDYDWDSGDSWDSGGTNWDSDW